MTSESLPRRQGGRCRGEEKLAKALNDFLIDANGAYYEAQTGSSTNCSSGHDARRARMTLIETKSDGIVRRMEQVSLCRAPSQKEASSRAPYVTRHESFVTRQTSLKTS